MLLGYKKGDFMKNLVGGLANNECRISLSAWC